jgi:hypothetical protein
MVYVYMDPTRLGRIALHFLPYRPFGRTGCLVMASLSYGALSTLPAAQEQSVIAEEYQGQVILLPEWLHEHSDELIDNQKFAIDHGAVSTEGVTRLELHPHWGWVLGKLLVCYYINIPPIGREWLHIIYPDFVPFSWIEIGSRVVAGIFGIQQKAWFADWFKHISAKNPEMNIVMQRYSKYFERYLEKDAAEEQH